MTDENLEDKYPHWKDALFGNHNAVANLRCAVHYGFWHSVYALIAVLGVLVVGGIKLGKALSPVFGPLGRPLDKGLDKLARTAATVANHEYTERIAGGALTLLFVGGLLYAIAVMVWMLYHNFWMTMQAIGFVVGVTAVGLGLLILFEKMCDPAKSAAAGVAVSARAVGERAVETPGIRRVYGQCPVSMEQAPKWFDNIFPEDDI